MMNLQPVRYDAIVDVLLSIQMSFGLVPEYWILWHVQCLV